MTARTTSTNPAAQTAVQPSNWPITDDDRRLIGSWVDTGIPTNDSTLEYAARLIVRLVTAYDSLAAALATAPDVHPDYDVLTHRQLGERYDEHVEEAAELVATALVDELDGDGDAASIVLEHLDRLVDRHHQAMRFLFELVGRAPAELNLEERVAAWLDDYAIHAPPPVDVPWSAIDGDEVPAP